MWYKKEGDKLLKGTKIFNKDFAIDNSSDRSQVINGWKWFDSDDDAYQYFQLDKPTEDKHRR